MNENILITLGFRELFDHERCALLSYGARLLNRLEQGEFGEPPEDEESLYAFEDYLACKCPSDDMLRQILGRIKNSRRLEKAQVPAMLASFPQSALFDYTHYERIKAWTLLSTIGLSLEGGHEHTIHEAARRVRRMLIPGFNWMLNEFPDFNQTLSRTVDNLNKLRKSYANNEERKDRRIENIYCLLRDYMDKRTQRTREIGESDVADTPQLLSSLTVSPASSLEDEEYEFTEIIDRPTKFVETLTIQEQVGDQAIGSKFIQADNVKKYNFGQSIAMNAIRAKSLANRLSMREMLLPSDWGTLTRHEQLTVLRECWKDACNNNFPALIIILMLLTGRSQKRLIKIFTGHDGRYDEKFAYKENGCALAYTHNLPRHNVTKEATKLLYEAHDILYLTLPIQLTNPVKSFQNSDPIQEEFILSEVKNIITSINRKFCGHITPARISGSMHVLMRKHSKDPADAAIVCGHSAEQYPPLFYYSPEIDDIYDTYIRCCKKLFSDSDIVVTYPQLKPQNNRIGTRLIMHDKHISALFQEQIKDINRLRQYKLCDPINFHNEYVLYVYQILCLGTGHRPVTKPFEFYSDFDLIRKTVWISDKESRSGLSARTIFMPDILCKQISEYNKHLQQLQHQINISDSKLSLAIQDVQQGRLPYLFFISKNSRCKHLKPSLIKEKMKDRWPLPLNWHRHYMRTKLKNYGLSGDEVNAWMGHAKFGEEAQGPWSGFSILHMKNIQDTVGNVLKQLNIQPLGGWVIRG